MGEQAAGQAGNLFQMLSQSLEQIDTPKEIDIGRQLAAVLLGSKPLHPDMALQRYVNRLGRWISLQSTRPDLPWTFAVLNDSGSDGCRLTTNTATRPVSASCVATASSRGTSP